MRQNQWEALRNLRLSEQVVGTQIAPLFSRALAQPGIYLANHSLGRPLDAMEDDLIEAASLWYDRPEAAWDAWLAERERFRGTIAQLIGAARADCVVPKSSAGEALRTVLNSLPIGAGVVSTSGEFHSIDVILSQYAAMGRIRLTRLASDGLAEDGEDNFRVEGLIDLVERGADLVVVSQVFFETGQVMERLDALAKACHRHGALLLVDAYHAVGALPVDVGTIGADFLVGGCYKYLRGGPGSAFLYVAADLLERGWRTLDRGWFAAEESACTGDALLGDTPPIFPWYQARSGLAFTLAVGVEQLRAYGLAQLAVLRSALHEAGVGGIRGGDSAHGAFLSIRSAQAQPLVGKLGAMGVVCNARGEWLRLCPDCLTTEAELLRAAHLLGEAMRG